MGGLERALHTSIPDVVRVHINPEIASPGKGIDQLKH
jgi:hypothetical protein